MTQTTKDVSKYNDSMQISMRGNSIRFITPDGQVFYKNLRNLTMTCLRALETPKLRTLALAPRDGAAGVAIAGEEVVMEEELVTAPLLFNFGTEVSLS